MYVNRKQQWTFSAILAVLLIIGMVAMVVLPEKSHTPHHSSTNQKANPDEENHAGIKSLLDRYMKSGERHSFSVFSRGHAYTGHYSGESFELTGWVNNKRVTMKRQGDQMSLTLDGEVLDPLTLPFALYTPFEHLKLLQNQSVHPIPVVQDQGTKGYLFHLQTEQVQHILQSWLGPAFSVEDVWKPGQDAVHIDYLLWYDQKKTAIKEMHVTLTMHMNRQTKVETLTFRM